MKLIKVSEGFHGLLEFMDMPQPGLVGATKALTCILASEQILNALYLSGLQSSFVQVKRIFASRMAPHHLHKSLWFILKLLELKIDLRAFLCVVNQRGLAGFSIFPPATRRSIESSEITSEPNDCEPSLD
uniref:Uncharacterized protein n=1 Tax=Curvibacter symbiont subsp. Hydra magnipapillata TaxID=667019 RepID=C9YAL0_CURXX|nr:hypothetical protein Csp_A11610 [Curvibacter putative symbiont of Hydra magnipapillata]